MFPYDADYKKISTWQRGSLKSIELYAEPFLRFNPRAIRNFPSHGVDHTVGIISNINSFIESWNISLSKNERYLLYLSAWLHDIGCLKGRKDHNIKSFNILLENGEICGIIRSESQYNLTNLAYLINSHSSNYRNINAIPIKSGNARIRLLCGIFRLMDACEICNTKCPKQVYDCIHASLQRNIISHSFWLGHMNIKDLSFSKPKIFITVTQRRNIHSTQIIKKLRSEISSIKKIFLENGLDVPLLEIRSCKSH